jgi:hypothetical protein
MSAETEELRRQLREAEKEAQDVVDEKEEEESLPPGEGEPNLGWSDVLGEHAGNPPQDRQSGDTLFALGREWKVAPLEYRIRAQFEEWVRAGALKVIEEVYLQGYPEQAHQMRSTYIGDCGAGHYNWDGKHCRSARTDVPGLHYYVYLLLRRCDRKVTLSQVRAIWKENASACTFAIHWAEGNEVSPEEEASGGNGRTTQKRDAKTRKPMSMDD